MKHLASRQKHLRADRDRFGRALPFTLGIFLSLALCNATRAQQAQVQPPQQPPVNRVDPGIGLSPGVGTQTPTPLNGELAPAPVDDANANRPPPFFIQPSISTELTSTNNANFGSSGQSHAEVLVEIAPALTIIGSGAHYRVNGQFEFDGVAYLDHTQPDRILPRGNLNFNADLVDNLLYLDAGVRSVRATENPFAISSAGPTTTFNEVTTTQYRVSPYIARELTPDLTLLARSDDIWSTGGDEAGVTSTDGFFGTQSLRLDSRPRPIGWSAEVSSAESRFRDQGGDALKDDAVRLTPKYAFDPFLVGIIVGYEKAYFDASSTTHSIVGLRADWHPTSRTEVDAVVEERFFGTGWNLRAAERANGLVLSSTWARDVTTYPALLASPAGTGYVPALLNSLLTGQYSNPVAREGAAQALFLTSGLPADLPGAAQVASAQALLVDSASMNAVLLGKYNSVSLTLYRTRTTTYGLPGEPIVLTVADGVFVANVQTGGTINFDHKLNPTMDVSTTLLRANTDGLGASSGTTSRQTSLILQLNDRLSLRTSAFLGLRHQILDSNLVTSSTESAVFVGLNHRF